MPLARRWSGTARIMRGPELIDERSAGSAAGAGSPRCSPDMRFQAGSISKLVLSAVTLELANRRQLNLDDPITGWLDNTPPQWSSITLRQLLSHTSGLGHWGSIHGLPPVLETPPARDDLVAMIIDTPLDYPPGTDWRYSGPGFIVAALVIEAATRRPYGDMAAELIFEPAGLQDTTSGELPVAEAGVATGHRDGQPIHVDPGFTDLPGTGDLWTTTEDLIHLSQALRAGQVINPASAAQLWTPQTNLTPDKGSGGPMTMDAYGLGTFLGRLAGHPARMNPGDNPGYQSLLAYLPAQDLDIAVLCNEDAPNLERALTELRLDG